MNSRVIQISGLKWFEYWGGAYSLTWWLVSPSGHNRDTATGRTAAKTLLNGAGSKCVSRVYSEHTSGYNTWKKYLQPGSLRCQLLRGWVGVVKYCRASILGERFVFPGTNTDWGGGVKQPCPPLTAFQVWWPSAGRDARPDGHRCKNVPFFFPTDWSWEREHV